MKPRLSAWIYWQYPGDPAEHEGMVLAYLDHTEAGVLVEEAGTLNLKKVKLTEITRIEEE